ncbi:MAG: CHAT domain-containing tetratricopeptide repeat protein [Acidimicrobiales bacterium]
MTKRPSPSPFLAAAERALATVADDPLRAEAAARAVLSDRDVDNEAASVAQRTIGLAARETGRLSAARSRLRRALALAEAGRLDVRAVEARLSLALALLQSGDAESALGELDKAAAQATRELRGQVFLQRALMYLRLDRFDEALQESRRALPVLRRSGDRLNEARLLSNRGVLHAYRNELGLAEADLNRALRRYEALGNEIPAAQVLHNLGYVSALKGDVPEALRRYDQAAVPFTERGLAAPALSTDRAQLMLSARLLPEARSHIEAGVRALEAARSPLDLAEARLLLSEIALADGDLAAATSAARASRRQFLRQGRTRWAALARFVEAQARWATNIPPTRISDEAGSLAEALNAEGWVLASLECRLIGARSALGTGDADAATSLVAGIDKRARNGPATQRVRSWYGEALGRLSRGDQRGALTALRAGLKIAEDHRASLGATDLRVRTATTVSELAGLGLDLAFESGRAWRVLQWSERWRAGALRTPRVTPPSDEALGTMLATLRDTVARIERGSLSGHAVDPLVDQQRKIEEAIRHRSRFASGDFVPAPRFPDPGELREAVGDRALVEYVEHEGQIHAVVVTRTKISSRLLATFDEVATERATLQFALTRLVLRNNSRASLDAAALVLERSCVRLAGLLVGPLQRAVGDRDLVVVPTGELHTLPWALLPSLRSRTITVSPSAALWYSRQHEPAPPPAGADDREAGVVLVAGPRVAQATAEISRIRKAFYPRARVLQGRAATVRAVSRAFERRRLVHLAAHGTFRADNPLFSSLELADGPLTVYDLEQMEQPPEWMVLSACDAGRSEVQPGDELMGTSAALLSLGTRAVVAAATPVPSDGVTPFMFALHAGLVHGHGLARALAVAQQGVLGESFLFGDLASEGGLAREALAAAAFVCLGAG